MGRRHTGGAFLVPAGPGGRCAGKTSAATLTVGLERAGAGGCRPGDGGGDVVRRSPRDMYVGWTGWACGHCWGPGGLSLSGGDIPTHRRHSAGGNLVKLAGVAGRETGEATWSSTANGLLYCAIDTRTMVFQSAKAFSTKNNPGPGRENVHCRRRSLRRPWPMRGQGREFDLEIRPAGIRPGKFHLGLALT